MNNKKGNMLVVDLEATCWRGHPPVGMFNEIIEIGIAILDLETKEVTAKDSILIKPTYSTISPFCTELTTLTQELLEENGVTLEEAVDKLINEYKSNKVIWGSWGNYDRNQFKKDCERKRVKYPFSDNHFNIKPLFSFKFGKNKDFGVSSALEYLNMPFEGTQHRGVDDAVNIAKIVKEIFR